MTEEERMALVLGTLDTAIQSLANTRDLLALAFVGGLQAAPQPADSGIPEGECQHLHQTSVTTMGTGDPAPFCIDCETIL